MGWKTGCALGAFLELKAAGLDRTKIVGDAFAPRRVPVALVEAHSIVRQI